MLADCEGLIELVDGKYQMNEIAFEKLIEGFKCGIKTQNALKLIYVDKFDRSEAIRQAGVKEGTLSKAVKRFEQWIEQYLAATGRVRKEYLVTEALELAFDALERDCLTGQSSLAEQIEQKIKSKQKNKN